MDVQDYKSEVKMLNLKTKSFCSINFQNMT